MPRSLRYEKNTNYIIVNFHFSLQIKCLCGNHEHLCNTLLSFLLPCFLKSVAVLTQIHKLFYNQASHGQGLSQWALRVPSVCLMLASLSAITVPAAAHGCHMEHSHYVVLDLLKPLSVWDLLVARRSQCVKSLVQNYCYYYFYITSSNSYNSYAPSPCAKYEIYLQTTLYYTQRARCKTI